MNIMTVDRAEGRKENALEKSNTNKSLFSALKDRGRLFLRRLSPIGETTGGRCRSLVVGGSLRLQ